MHRGITAAGKSSSTAASSAGAPAVAATAVLGECALCGDEMTARSSLDLGCAPNGEHRFCLSCWRSWATAEMDKGPQAIFTRCCGYKCNEILPDDLFLSLLDTKKQRLLSRWFIRSAALGGATLSAHVLLLPSAHASASSHSLARPFYLIPTCCSAVDLFSFLFLCLRSLSLFNSIILFHFPFFFPLIPPPPSPLPATTWTRSRASAGARLRTAAAWSATVAAARATWSASAARDSASHAGSPSRTRPRSAKSSNSGTKRQTATTSGTHRQAPTVMTISDPPRARARDQPAVRSPSAVSESRAAASTFTDRDSLSHCPRLLPH